MFMYRENRQSGFSLIEVLTAVAIIAILAGALLGLGKHLRIQAEENLTLGTMGILESALDQYYDVYQVFPFVTKDSDLGTELGIDEFFDQDDFEAVLSDTLNKNVTIQMIDSAPSPDEWSNAGMVYFLRNYAKSRRILDTISASLITSTDDKGKPAMFRLAPASLNIETELLRIRDAWGHAIVYRYDSGDAYPLLVSPGPDGNILTEGDNVRND